MLVESIYRHRYTHKHTEDWNFMNRPMKRSAIMKLSIKLSIDVEIFLFCIFNVVSVRLEFFFSLSSVIKTKSRLTATCVGTLSFSHTIVVTRKLRMNRQSVLMHLIESNVELNEKQISFSMQTDFAFFGFPDEFIYLVIIQRWIVITIRHIMQHI